MYAGKKSILFRLNTDREHCSWSYCLCVMLNLAKERAALSSQRLNDLSKLIPSLFKALWWNDFFHIFLYFFICFVFHPVRFLFQWVLLPCFIYDKCLCFRIFLCWTQHRSMWLDVRMKEKLSIFYSFCEQKCSQNFP